MILDRRLVLGAGVALPCCAAFGANERAFTPEEFGARGDGHTNDSDAFARLAAAVNLNGGGTIAFRRATYLVGAQVRTAEGQYLYNPHDLLVIAGCRRPVRLVGNGARLLCAPGLRYGVFDARGAPRETAMPYLGDGLGTPYRAMVQIEDCAAAVTISDLTLEGPGDLLLAGGRYGDVGWQIPAAGLVLRNNRGSEIIERVTAIGHPLDGVLIDGLDDETPGVARHLIEVVARDNGRQGCSVVGGRGYRFERCSFMRTGRGRITSPPGAGVDIEAEGGKRIRNLEFIDSRFADNVGAGMVADSGDSDGVRFSRCVFVGTTNWSAWASKPRFSFDDCTFAGAMTRAFGGDPDVATKFVRCTFTDDPALSPTGHLYGGVNSSRPLADLGGSRNILFDRCHFLALHGSALPWSTGAIYRDCTLIQGHNVEGYPRGRFVGTNRITGKVDLYGSRFEGATYLNGRLLPR